MPDKFHVVSTARQDAEDRDQGLFVGEMDPQNAERPWLVIRGGTSGPFVIAGPHLALPADPG